MQLDTVTAHDIADVTIDTNAKELVVTVHRHAGTGVVEYVERIGIGQDATHEIARAARETAAHLVTIAAQAVRRRVAESGVSPCATCTGACCRQWDVELVPHDALAVPTNFVETYSEPDVSGAVGRMRKVEWRNPLTGGTELACIGLRKDGTCGIYDQRPTICREFSAYNCDEKEEWPDAPKKRRLRVLKT